MDRRAVFFIGSAFVCLLLIPVTPADLRWVPGWLAVVYAVLALASYLDARSRAHASRPGDDRSDHR